MLVAVLASGAEWGALRLARRTCYDGWGFTENDMSKAIRIHANGGPEVMVWEDVPTPEPGPNEALVKQHAVGLKQSFGVIHLRPQRQQGRDTKGAAMSPLHRQSGQLRQPRQHFLREQRQVVDRVFVADMAALAHHQ